MQVIDVHVHLNYYNNLNQGQAIPSLQSRLEFLLASMRTNNIEYSLILTSYIVNSTRPPTSDIIKIVDKNKMSNQVGIVASYTISNNDFKDIKKYKTWLKNGLIKGIKIYCGYEYYYPNDERYQPIYDLCTEYKIPVMIHTGDTYSPKGKIKYSHPLNVDEIAVDNPDLNIIICHLGNPWILDCQEVIYKNKNVYADISGLVEGNFNKYNQRVYGIRIKEMLEYIGKPHRLLFGSDWPISNMNSYINFVENLKLDNEAIEFLLVKNAQNIFHI